MVRHVTNYISRRNLIVTIPQVPFVDRFKKSDQQRWSKELEFLTKLNEFYIVCYNMIVERKRGKSNWEPVGKLYFSWVHVWVCSVYTFHGYVVCSLRALWPTLSFS